MPVREVDIQYEFPSNENHRVSIIEAYRTDGMTWVSTAIVEGRMRMKFCRFEHYIETASERVIDARPYKTREDIGLLRKNQRKIPKASDKIGYSGRLGSDRPEWDR